MFTEQEGLNKKAVEAGREAVIEVSDTGIGIAVESHPGSGSLFSGRFPLEGGTHENSRSMTTRRSSR